MYEPRITTSHIVNLVKNDAQRGNALGRIFPQTGKAHFPSWYRNCSITPGNSAFRRYDFVDNAQHFQVIPTKVGIQIFFFDVRLPRRIEQLRATGFPGRPDKAIAASGMTDVPWSLPGLVDYSAQSSKRAGYRLLSV